MNFDPFQGGCVLSEVKAQAGKGLTNAQAQQLTTDATHILAVIGC